MKKTKFKIFAATAVTIFTLASTFSATIAWFEANYRRTVTSGNFAVVGPDGLGFDLYYLSEFTDEESHTKYGNYNPSITSFSGYERDYEDATFTKVNYEGNTVTNDPDPTDVRHLWPAHKLTFAIVITNKTIEKLSLSDWGETTGTAVTEDSDLVCLSWAIDIYGAAYSIEESDDSLDPEENTAADVAAGYISYREDGISGEYSDIFNYSEADPADTPRETLDVVDTVPVNADGYRTIVYFTIEFSNDSDTFYQYDKENDYYVKSVSGNSNCYEGLSLSSLKFSLS